MELNPKHTGRDIRQEITNIEIEIKTHMLDTNRRQDSEKTNQKELNGNTKEINKPIN